MELEISEDKLDLSEDVEDLLLKEIVPIGNGAHVTCPKEYIGRKVFLVVCKE